MSSSVLEVTKLRRRPCLSVNGEFSGILEASSLSCGGILTRLTWIVFLQSESIAYKTGTKMNFQKSLKWLVDVYDAYDVHDVMHKYICTKKSHKFLVSGLHGVS